MRSSKDLLSSIRLLGFLSLTQEDSSTRQAKFSANVIFPISLSVSLLAAVEEEYSTQDCNLPADLPVTSYECLKLFMTKAIHEGLLITYIRDFFLSFLG